MRARKRKPEPKRTLAENLALIEKLAPKIVREGQEANEAFKRLRESNERLQEQLHEVARRGRWDLVEAGEMLLKLILSPRELEDIWIPRPDAEGNIAPREMCFRTIVPPGFLKSPDPLTTCVRPLGHPGQCRATKRAGR